MLTAEKPGAVSMSLSNVMRNVTGPGRRDTYSPSYILAGVPVSVIIPVRNEADNLRRCLPALAWADEIFIIDSQSQDLTSRVAAEFGAQVVQFYFNGRYPKKKNWALENLPLRNEWVLIVDADEIVKPELAFEISERISATEVEGYYLNSDYFFLGHQLRYCGYSECWNLRLFRHKLGRYEYMPDQTQGRAGDNEAHEHVELRGRACRLRHRLQHHAYPTIYTWVEKHNRYAVWEAAMYYQIMSQPIPRAIGYHKYFKRLMKRLFLRLPMRPLIRFIYAYFIRLGFLDGRAGLVFCLLLSFYDILAWANLYEQNINRVKVK
jgi:glycosyltransferase involved in cell wall biosynthesis